MSGVQHQIRPGDDAALKHAFARALGLGASRPAILKDLGEANLIATRDRFRDEKGPDGARWAALNADYRRTKRGRKILQGLGMRGGLLGSIAWQLLTGGEFVAVGTNKEYARIHQEGGTIVPKHAKFLRFALGGRRVQARKVTIPARPYLGVADGERAAQIEIINDHVAERFGGPR